ncbi:APC family permease [Neisseria shayeganii]|uniref:APC family permease n=1 Tax=Neisseria shayeganii TaxID=607712 RepID=A0A7D7N6W1_9NEIS|nr:APC family permease [Neisseria shayeganii]QMT40101.1 APC family permease [Neisseria shayeganii]
MSNHHLAKVLGKKEAFMLAFGAMIGWGWIVLSGGWVQEAGSIGAPLALALGAGIIMVIGLCYAELCSAMPYEGGEHVFSYRAMGHAASFLCTWAMILGYVSVVAFEAVALPTVLDNLIPGYQVGYLWNLMGQEQNTEDLVAGIRGGDVYFTWALVGMAGTVVVTWLNYIGIKTAARFQTFVTYLILLVGLVFIIAAPISGDAANLQPLFNETPVEGSVFSPMMAGMLAVLLIVPFMFVGFDVIPQAAAEINLPQKDIGKMLLLSVAAATIFYCAITFGVGIALNEQQLNDASLPTATAMEVVFNSPLAAKIMILAGVAGIITSWNAFFIGGSRAIYAMAHAKMLPAFLAKTHPKYKTPHNAVLLIGAATLFAPFLGRKALVWFVDAGSLSIVIAYFMVCMSLLVLRRRAPNMPRPFRLKKGIFIGAAGCCLSLFLGYMYLPFSPAALTKEEWWIFGGWMVFGFILYSIARSKYGTEESDRIMEAEWANEHEMAAAQAKQNAQ